MNTQESPFYPARRQTLSLRNSLKRKGQGWRVSTVGNRYMTVKFCFPSNIFLSNSIEVKGWSYGRGIKYLTCSSKQLYNSLAEIKWTIRCLLCLFDLSKQRIIAWRWSLFFWPNFIFFFMDLTIFLRLKEQRGIYEKY